MKKELDAKAAGLQFIPASKLQEKVKAAGSDEDQEEGEEEEGEDENKMFGGIVYRKTEDDFIYTGISLFWMSEIYYLGSLFSVLMGKETFFLKNNL